MKKYHNLIQLLQLTAFGFMMFLLIALLNRELLPTIVSVIYGNSGDSSKMSYLLPIYSGIAMIVTSIIVATKIIINRINELIKEIKKINNQK